MNQKNQEKYKNLTKILIKAIRGERSQGQINKALHFNFNQISKWERGNQPIRWNEFLQLCDHCKVTENFLQNTMYIVGSREWPSVFQQLVNFKKNHIKIDKLDFKKLTADNANPKLYECLYYIDLLSYSLTPFLHYFIPLRDLPDSFQKQINNMKSEVEVAVAIPETIMFTCAISTKKYLSDKRSTEVFMEEEFYISPLVTKRIINLCLEAHIIKKEHDKYQLDHTNNNPNNGNIITLEQFFTISRKISKISNEFVNFRKKCLHPKDGNSFINFHIFSANDKAVKESIRV